MPNLLNLRINPRVVRKTAARNRQTRLKTPIQGAPPLVLLHKRSYNVVRFVTMSRGRWCGVSRGSIVDSGFTFFAPYSHFQIASSKLNGVTLPLVHGIAFQNSRIVHRSPLSFMSMASLTSVLR